MKIRNVESSELILHRADLSYSVPGLNLEVPLYLQEGRSDCALASVAMIAEYNGKSALELAAFDIEGERSVSEVALVLRQIGLEVQTLRVPVARLKDIKLPAIVHWLRGHFVVLVHVEGDLYGIHDPARGVQELSEHEFSKLYSGAVIQICPPA